MSLPGSIGLLSRLPSPASSIFGNVDGPSSAIDNSYVIFSGATGKLIKQAGSGLQLGFSSASVSTTDETVTTVQTITIPASTTLSFDGYVVSRRTGGASGTAEDGASYRVEGVFKNAAGTATSIGSSITVIGESQAGWDVTIDATGATARIRVTGAASNSITWTWTGNIRQVSS